jgi:hypothetical protein
MTLYITGKLHDVLQACNQLDQYLVLDVWIPAKILLPASVFCAPHMVSLLDHNAISMYQM